MKTKTLAIGIIAATLLFTGCAKDGATGPKGPAGATGTPGTNGTANISTTTLNVTSWIWNATLFESTATFTVTALTQNVIDKGAIMVYWTPAGMSEPLPYTHVLSPSLSKIVNFSFDVNAIVISQSNSDESNPNPLPTTYRLVVIPPAMKKPNVNMNDYNAVKAAYKLTD